MEWTVYLTWPQHEEVARFISSPSEALWYLLQCRWWGTFCCISWTVPRPGRWGTSQSSRRRRSCSPDSRWYIWDHPSRTRSRRWAEAASPWGTQTEGGRSHRSLQASPEVEILVRSHFQDGRTSETAEFHRSCSSPVEQPKLHNMLCNKADNGMWAENQLTTHCPLSLLSKVNKALLIAITDCKIFESFLQCKPLKMTFRILLNMNILASVPVAQW